MNKSTPLIVAVVLLVTFAAGRYSVKQPEAAIQTETKSTADKERHKETTTVTTKDPDGKEITTTKIVEDTSTVIKKDSDTSTKVKALSTLNVSALGAYKDGQLNYGLSVNKQFIGPTSIGLWGLNNGTIGLSIGVNF